MSKQINARGSIFVVLLSVTAPASETHVSCELSAFI